MDDLKDYPLGAFQVIHPGDAAVALVCIFVWALILAPYIK